MLEKFSHLINILSFTRLFRFLTLVLPSGQFDPIQCLKREKRRENETLSL